MCFYVHMQPVSLNFFMKNPAKENTNLILSDRVGKMPAMVLGLSP